MWDKVGGDFVSRVPELYGPMREKQIPLYVISNMVRSRSDAGRRAAADGNGVTAYNDLEMACRSLAEMARYHAWRRDRHEQPGSRVAPGRSAHR